MQKNKKLIYIILIAISLIVVFVVVWLMNKKPAAPVSSIIPPKVEQATTSQLAMADTLVNAQTDCTKLATDFERNKCVQGVSLSNAVKGCKDAACADQAKMDDALISNDASRCASIINQVVRDKCKIATDVTVDSDKDSITDYNEVHLYYTNPNNPDTDGDGHLDSEEINNGFNPCGDGNMPAATDLANQCKQFATAVNAKSQEGQALIKLAITKQDSKKCNLIKNMNDKALCLDFFKTVKK